MSPLTLILHIFLGSTLAGSAVIAVLVLGFASWTAMLIAAVAGFVAAFPVSYMVSRKLEG
ncbi:CTP synthetase [Ruegeria sp. HKCCA5426]|uniref:CTP synthetase n=1 Tax=Ruegeria sp. HKCCA5426 TaxID=2682985 RepID=UPI00148879A8|nr:CTP synthetase [Ruegeria sp. HKCCA5426]